MCYDIKVSSKAQLKRARQKGDLTAIEEIEELLIPLTDLPLHHVSGFSHPEFLIYTDSTPEFPTVATWGLIPHWVKQNDQMKKIWNNTLNARGETIFDKPAFSQSAKNNRCIIYIDGFYEHHHFNNKTYPFFIQRQDNEPMALAGLWSAWVDPETGGKIISCSIVTTKGNTMLAKIHNNPKISEPRMPLILPEYKEDDWLIKMDNDSDKKQIQERIQTYPTEKLKAYTVGKLRGKAYKGNVPEISNKVDYNELQLHLP